MGKGTDDIPYAPALLVALGNPCVLVKTKTQASCGIPVPGKRECVMEDRRAESVVRLWYWQISLLHRNPRRPLGVLFQPA